MATERALTVADYAERLARDAHGDDRNPHDGERYILHVERVVEHLRLLGADATTQAVAWLHDVVEDTPVTYEEIRHSFGTQIAEAVDCLTHRKGESRADYYARIGPNRLALTVKLSDGRDNQNPARKATLSDATRERLRAKYEHQNYVLASWVIHHLKEN